MQELIFVPLQLSFDLPQIGVQLGRIYLNHGHIGNTVEVTDKQSLLYVRRCCLLISITVSAGFPRRFLMGSEELLSDITTQGPSAEY
jgi:hypothetical protein